MTPKADSCGEPSARLTAHVMGIVFLLPVLALAQEFPAFVQTSDYTNYGWGVNTTRGWQFTVTQEIEVEKLGFWDSGLNGLVEAHPIGIWRDEDGVLLTSATVPAGTATPLEGTFRWVATAPVVLKPGKTYVIGTYWMNGSADPNLEGGTNTIFDARVTVLGGRGINAVGLNFPVLVVSAELAVNFKARPLPAPLTVTDAFLAGTRFTIRFRSDAGVTAWKVKGSTDLQTFNIDRTADSTITETSPGVYEALVELGSLGNRYFLRIERQGISGALPREGQ